MINFERLTHLLGDEAAAQRFLDIFQNEAPRQLDALYRDLDSENWSAVSNTAHSLKSQLRYLGLDDIAELAYRIEQSAEREEELDWLPQAIAELETQLNRVLDAL